MGRERKCRLAHLARRESSRLWIFVAHEGSYTLLSRIIYSYAGKIGLFEIQKRGVSGMGGKREPSFHRKSVGRGQIGDR